MALGVKAYKEILEKSKLSNDRKMVEKIQRIGKRIASVADRPDFQWEFNLIEDDKMVNAFCLPGGKVAFYSGILPYCKDEEGIAAVMGHEIGHAIARHGAERMTTGLLAELGQAGLNAAIANQSSTVIEGLNVAYGAAANVGVILPFSRLEESEADRIGLILMAKAGYDPRASIQFWQRMAKGSKQKPLEFLSTHPSDETRIRKIESWLPEALQYYKGK
jgi:predicted Zn-dependent protease